MPRSRLFESRFFAASAMWSCLVAMSLWASLARADEKAAPGAVDGTKEEAVLLTPKPGPEPKINGPVVYGARPGRPFVYRIPCTGQRPIVFSAEGLPEGWTLDAASGVLLGQTPTKRGDHPIVFHAKNARGESTRPFNLVVGDTLALTPPMGWNHWYTHYHGVTDRLFRDAADAMVASGMADFGYQYVNIDDCWMIKPGSTDPKLRGEPRDAKGAIRPNGNFPDMKALTAYIHAKGLRAGIYTSPGPRTCAGYVGSYRHEKIDAQTFADWGFDFLKHDWCTYGDVAGGNDLAHLKRPYQKMGDVLRGLDRDMVYNLCQYGMGDVWKWGAEVGGNSWRTTHDLGLRAADRLPGFYRIGLSNARHHAHAGPGHWNDPDYILIGKVGNAFRFRDPPRPTSLTPNEQYSYMSMWCLMASPLFFSGHMGHLDEFTLNVLCNAEMIDVDQDPLGKQAVVVRQSEDELVMAKPMADGSLVVGLFNLSETQRNVGVDWSELKLTGPRRARDVWRQKDLPPVEGRLESSLGRHGVRVVRLWPPLATGASGRNNAN